MKIIVKVLSEISHHLILKYFLVISFCKMSEMAKDSLHDLTNLGMTWVPTDLQSTVSSGGRVIGNKFCVIVPMGGKLLNL